VLPGRTAEIDIVVTADGERHFPAGGYRPNVLRQLQITDDIRQFVSRHDIVVSYLGDDTPTDNLQALLGLKRHALRFVVDFGSWSGGRRGLSRFPMFHAVDLAFVSGDEGTVRELTAAKQKSGTLVVVTLGAAGSVALTPDGPVSQPAGPVEYPVDSTGCGDAFQAAFAVSFFRDGDVERALERGAWQAAQVLGHFGAFEQEEFVQHN
jgi:fructoselysine 6-kinase